MLVVNSSKPRLAIVSSHNICCPLAFYADSLREFLSLVFDVEIIDLKTSQLLRQEGENYQKMSEAYINELCERLREFDVVNVHLELGLYGTKMDLITSRILKICQASGRLILTVHTIDYRNSNSSHGRAYQQIITSLKKRPSSNPFHIIVHLNQEKPLMEKIYGLNNVSDFPLIFLTDKRRAYFQAMRNPNTWKKQFGLNHDDITIGMFGLMSAHKNYLHALRTINLLPNKFKLLVVGEAHHMNIKQGQVDPVIQEIVGYLESHPNLADRVIFTGRRPDEKYYEDLANIDFVLLPSFEMYQTGSATLSTALELSCSILKSNISNATGYETYFPDCFEVFDVGNYFETKDKILNFDKSKIENLNKKINFYSEIQLREMYLDIYESMRAAQPIEITKDASISYSNKLQFKLIESPAVRKIFYSMPRPLQSLIKKVRRVLAHQ